MKNRRKVVGIVVMVLLVSAAIPENSGAATARISAGGGNALALKSDGTLWAWGFNGYGQLGDETGTTRLSPVQIQFMNRPDLIVQRVVASPASPAAGQSVSITVTVKNQGSADAGGFSVDFYKNRIPAPEGQP